MLLAEPPRTAYDLHFSLAGIPVRVHPFFWLAGVILGANSGDGAAILIWVGVVFVSILVHELGHAFTMRRFQESPRIVLYMLGGLAISDSAWSVGHRRSRNSFEQIVISAAGPIAGFLLAAFVVLLVHAAGGNVRFQFSHVIPNWHVQLPLDAVEAEHQHYLRFLIDALLWVNIFWGLVNLLPVYPLDGGQIAREVCVQRDAWDGVRRSLWLSVITGAVVAIGGLAVLGEPFIAIMFGLLAFSNWQVLQQMSGGGGPWGGGRPW